MIPKINIKEAAKELGYKDCRSVKRWCNNHNIKILSDIGSNRQYILKEEFETSRDKESLKYIKQKYGIDKIPKTFNLENKINNQRIKYIPQGKSEKEFLASSIFTKN